MAKSSSNVVPGPTHDGPAPEFTGGRHPRGSLYPGDQTGDKAKDAGSYRGQGMDRPRSDATSEKDIDPWAD